MSSLVDLSPIAYNGVTFPANADTTAVQARMVYDPAGRTVVHTLYQVTIRAMIAADESNPGGTNDPTLQQLRALLERPGGVLTYQNRGFGNLSVNGPGQPRDVLWGPRPKVLSWEPTGDNLSAFITWQVEVAIPECPEGASYQFQLMELNWKQSVSKDASGYSKRTVSGHYRIPQTRKAPLDRTLSDNADAYWEQVLATLPPPPVGFRRVPGELSLSEDKCRADFSYQDEEVGPNYLPPGVVFCDASHRERSRGPAFSMWEGELRGKYEVPRGLSPATVLPHFAALVVDRIQSTLPPGTAFVPTGLELGEPTIYEKPRAEVALRYRRTFRPEKQGLGALAGQLVGALGLWRPVPDNDWGGWADSMAEGANQGDVGAPWGPRGTAKLQFTNDQDAILDLCNDATGAPEHTSALATQPEVQLFREAGWEPPDPESSWLDYRAEIVLEPHDNVAELKPLALAQPSYDAAASGPGDNSGGAVSPWAQGNASTFQYRASPRQVVWLRGYAVRAGYPINPPQLVSVGGQPAVPANDGTGYFRTTKAAVSIVPIYAAVWAFRYLLPDAPAGAVAPPDNFLLDPPDAPPTTALTTMSGSDSGPDPGGPGGGLTTGAPPGGGGMITGTPQ